MVNEAMVPCPEEGCGPQRVEVYDQETGKYLRSETSLPFQAFADGYSGFLPVGSWYRGGGAYVTVRDNGEFTNQLDRTLAHGQKHETHCMMLARIVDEIANSTKDNKSFVRAVVDRFRVSDQEARTGTGRYREFNNSTGFKPEFTEPPNLPGGSPNQVHHYAGIFEKAYEGAMEARLLTKGLTGLLNPNAELASYYLARKYALDKANEHEDLPGNPEASKRADKALNEVVVDHAFKLAYGLTDRTQLGNLIRKEVCSD